MGNNPAGVCTRARGGISVPLRRRRAGRGLAAAALALGGVSCSEGSPSILNPHGPSARTIAGLWWLMLWISVAVLAVVLGLMAVAIARRRRRGLEVDPSEPRWGEPFVLIVGVLIPIAILSTVFVVSLRDMNAIARADPRLTIQVVGHMWWWEVRYPNGAVTANEIHIPVGEPVRVEVSTADVIHSFWVPQLGPKIDMIPGRTNAVVLAADRTGRYRGQCAEFCGLQHANMALFVIAQPPAAFEAWVRAQALPAATPTGEAAAGLAVFTGSSCAGCHTIRGTDASATLGPDLTHLASRQTLGAGTLANTPADLSAWIRDPQAFKPGAVMPPSPLTAGQLRAVVVYLQGLR